MWSETLARVLLAAAVGFLRDSMSFSSLRSRLVVRLIRLLADRRRALPLCRTVHPGMQSHRADVVILLRHALRGAVDVRHGSANGRRLVACVIATFFSLRVTHFR